MNNADFWASVRSIIAEGFTPEGLLKLDSYAEQFISGRLVYQRFSPQEQHGCAAGGSTNVIASLLAGAEAGSDSLDSQSFSDYQRECQLGAQQESVIERWAKTVGVWTDCVDEQLPKTLGEQIAEGGEAKVYEHTGTLCTWASKQRRQPFWLPSFNIKHHRVTACRVVCHTQTPLSPLLQELQSRSSTARTTTLDGHTCRSHS